MGWSATGTIAKGAARSACKARFATTQYDDVCVVQNEGLHASATCNDNKWCNKKHVSAYVNHPNCQIIPSTAHAWPLNVFRPPDT